MRAVLTRVTRASVTVDGETVGAIDSPGLLALVGVAATDTSADAQKMARKIAGLRILRNDESVVEADAPVLLVSQFTLMGSTTKGRRPSWSAAARPDDARPLFDEVAHALSDQGIHVETGRFGAMMEVHSVNDGPFTVLVET